MLQRFNKRLQGFGRNAPGGSNGSRIGLAYDTLLIDEVGQVLQRPARSRQRFIDGVVLFDQRRNVRRDAMGRTVPRLCVQRPCRTNGALKHLD